MSGEIGEHELTIVPYADQPSNETFMRRLEKLQVNNSALLFSCPKLYKKNALCKTVMCFLFI